MEWKTTSGMAILCDILVLHGRSGRWLDARLTSPVAPATLSV
jgi:hypothetical protein